LEYSSEIKLLRSKGGEIEESARSERLTSELEWFDVKSARHENAAKTNYRYIGILTIGLNIPEKLEHF
jgi:hypothetical protein